MSKQRIWHVEYDVQTSFDLTGATLLGNRGLALQRPAGAIDGSSQIYPRPENLKITEVIPPMEDGYYLSPVSGAFRKRSDGVWYSRAGVGGWDALSTRTDVESRRDGLFRIAPLGMEEDPEDE